MANHSLVENVNSVINTFNQAKAALIEKGVEVSNLATDIPSEIARIEGGGGEVAYYRYFRTTLTTAVANFECGFRPIKVIAAMNAGAKQYFSTAVNDNGTTRGSRFGEASATEEAGLTITLTDNGFTAKSFSNNYAVVTEFIAISDQEPEPTEGSNSWFGIVTLANGKLTATIETGLKNLTNVMWFGTNENYATGSFRNRQCGMWNSDSNKVTAVRTGLSTSNAGGATVTTPTANVGAAVNGIVNIDSMDAENGIFTLKAAANTNIYWGTYYVMAMAGGATPMLLSEGGEE